MCHNNNTSFLSKDLPIYKAEETNKENVSKQRETGLKGEILQRAIIGNFY